MYCLLKNSCKYEYKCCNHCKQKCDNRCYDNCVSCKFFTKTEPTVSYKFTVNGQEYSTVLNKPKKEDTLNKQKEQVVKAVPSVPSVAKVIKTNKKQPQPKTVIKLKKKKSLI